MNKRFVLLLFITLSSVTCFAQKPLTNSRQSSYFTYIYKLEAPDIEKFYKQPNEVLDEKMLHHPIDSFKTDKYWENTLPPGNYLKVWAEKNRLKYVLIENHTLELKLLQNDNDLRFILLDRQGTVVNNISAEVNGRTVPYDPGAGLYHSRNSKKDTLLKAIYNGVTNFFAIRQGYSYRRYSWLKYRWMAIKRIFGKKNNYYKPIIQKYAGFIVFNKPKYKPNDTVKFKAFVLQKSSKKPINVPKLLVRLKEDERDNGKIIGSVNSYREGGYEYQFILNDSLKLSLDQDYIVSLEDPSSAQFELDSYKGDDEQAFLAKRQVFISGKFSYEDYDLKSTSFSIRTDKKKHWPGNPLALYLKATDENNLPVPDGRVRITLTTRDIKDQISNHTFVPDTLWTHKMPLDPVGETKIIIPDSIFPKVDLDYNIEADFLNSANEHQYAREEETYTNNSYSIDAKLSHDTLVTKYQLHGKEISAPAFISALNASDDTILKVKVMLPNKMPINPDADSYSIETDSTETNVELTRQESGFTLSGYRTADSVFVKIGNERRLHYWYSVFAGNRLIDEGQADAPLYKRRFNGNGNITFIADYVWGGRSRAERTVVSYADKVLTINVKQPVSAYPGQKTQTDIVVTDINGKPVPNTDVTAWALTRKFEDYRAPFVPYFGKAYPNRKAKPNFDIKRLNDEGSFNLNWDRWGRKIGLDSIAYFQFTHPKTIYRIEEPGIDPVTQIAPFVVKNGDILPVHILFIDERPVYFSQAQQLQRYSFPVLPGKHFLRFRTANQSISLDTVSVEKGKKLILSVNADELQNDRATIKKVSDTLSTYEAGLINKYMITVVNNFGWKMATLQQGNHLILLNPEIHSNSRYGSILSGPLADNYAVFTLRGDAPRLFNTEPGYSYLFEPGLLKQKSIEAQYPFSRYLKNLPGTDDYGQYALTQNGADSLWQQYLDLRSYSQQLFENKPVTGKVTGSLNIGYIEGYQKPKPFIKNVIIYRYDDPDYIRVYPGITTNFGSLTPGKYRLFFLLKEDSYDIKDSVFVKPYGINFYRLKIGQVHKRDSVSIKINAVIANRSGERDSNDAEIKNDALKLKEAFNDKYFDTSDFGDMMSGRITGSDDKLPIVGCSLAVKGTRYGTVTDVNGYFRIKVPSSGKLVISFIGYQTKEIPVEINRMVDIKLVPASNALQEVVVIGYGTQRKSDLTGAVQSLAGMAAGVFISQGAPGAADSINIRGITSMGAAKPMIVIDGVVADNMDGIDPASIGEINVLKSAAATALYGSRAANGVIIINTKKKEVPATAQTAQQSDELSIRKNFSDYAYWQPTLTTDENGKASFTSTLPDDITNWRTFVIGINDNQQSGFTEGQIKSFKPLSASFIAPLFAVEGDELSAIGKITNYNSEPAKLTRTFSYNGKLLKQDAVEIGNSKIDTLKITAAKTDSLTFEYTIKRDNGYFDGEQRKIPVIEQGVKETKGVFEALNADTTVTMNFDPALGPVTLRAESSVLPALAEEAKHLREYKYLCNEQLASKLKGLLAEKRIRTYLGEPFKWERNVKEVIKKLQENRRTQGTWGWWKDTDEELWISLHAVEALTDAQTSGYTIDLDIPKLTSYLVYQLESYKGEEKLACLELLHKLNAKVDYPKYFDVITKEYAKQIKVSKYDQFRLMLLKQQTGQIVKTDSLYAIEKHTLFGNVYWGEDGYSFFDNSIQLSVLAYQIVKNENKHPELLAKICGYFLEQRRTGSWRNTYESSLILENILPDLLKENNTVKPASLTISGAKTETITAFPYNTTVTDKQLKINKSGSLPVYVSGYQQFWNRNPDKVNKDFTVNTWFEKNGDKISKLKGGERVQLKAEVNAKGDADFVMVEIPIPAGCSYESKEQSWQNNEVHREYFKEKVSIFCRKLKQGRYEFSIDLMPRYSGNYSLNPAKAEMMYFPVFYGREGMKKVVVGD